MKATQHHQLSNHPGTSSSTRPSLSLPSIHSSSCWWPLSIPRRPPTPVPPCSPRPVASRASPVARTRAASPGPMSCSLGSLPSPQPCPHSSLGLRIRPASGRPVERSLPSLIRTGSRTLVLHHKLFTSSQNLSTEGQGAKTR
ncbi:hypothetical protein EJB05_02788 [Eragrostis curvula]|uniref:Uncharacterized protein n=1 Tax=Eragrostis curvula TaxID=38414 RepID=A0A5J9WWI8_9POAL|nr:hypothetical protein EJB05_34906 [Eragrostis curvula]TVU51364.1 hypothetical protein EJB05_02788 [Eragrostis curvula]